MRIRSGLGILVVALGGCGSPEDIGGDNKNVLAPHCYDKKVSNDETDIDCGGADCLKCDNGKACAANGDCTSGACRNGVCVDPNACNAPCNFANAVGQCKAGRCELVSCNAGFGDCDQNTANGCEIDLGGDAANCGACGNVCNTRVCNAGKCDPGMPCGGFACNFANGVGQCINNKCTLVSCNAGFGDCNKNEADGCEVDLNANAANCGACGNVCNSKICNAGRCDPGQQGCGGMVCNFANGVGQCINNKCALVSCNAGFADCNQNPNDGCEVDLSSNAANCGACGVGCKGVACQNGVCGGGGGGPNCNQVGFLDCDRNAGNGCEVNSMSDPFNCGACGVLCLKNQKCVAGACL